MCVWPKKYHIKFEISLDSMNSKTNKRTDKQKPASPMNKNGKEYVSESLMD